MLKVHGVQLPMGKHGLKVIGKKVTAIIVIHGIMPFDKK
jgi:hypothetical protein